MKCRLKNIKFIARFSFIAHSLSFFVCLFLFGCQKVININLNSASPAIVIEGNINNQPGPYTVTVNQTVNFSQNNTFPPVTGAFITIADNAGTTDTLVESPPGIYTTTKINGVEGRTYTLKVESDGQTYTATSTMPQAVTFDTLGLIERIGFRDTNLYAEAGFKDPGNETNYYRFLEAINYAIQSRIFVLDDEYSNGRYINYTLRSDSSLTPGENVIVEMECIDQGTYQYFSTFNEATGATNLTPANPVSNFSNNALGYFSAHTSQYKALIVP
jgi:Domain of unknown function (DUF4249)